RTEKDTLSAGVTTFTYVFDANNRVVDGSAVGASVGAADHLRWIYDPTGNVRVYEEQGYNSDGVHRVFTNVTTAYYDASQQTIATTTKIPDFKNPTKTTTSTSYNSYDLNGRTTQTKTVEQDGSNTNTVTYTYA